MKVPNFIREFFLLPPRPPEPLRRTIVCGDGKAPAHLGTHKRHTFREGGGTPEPEVVRKKVKAGKVPELNLDDFQPTGREELKPELDYFWWGMYSKMLGHGTVRVDCNQHYGSLRGAHILLVAKRDFKRAGIPVQVKLCGSHGFISLLGKA